MSTLPESPLQVSANNLGPIAKLDATLSKYAQNIIFARNGTGKSFLTRALRYVDKYAQGDDISNAALDLVSEESRDSQGQFSLTRGGKHLASLSMNLRENQISANSDDRIFHVFSDDFVQSELRQRNFEMDGNVENEIRLDQMNIDTIESEKKLATLERAFATCRGTLQDALETQKIQQLVNEASISKRLKEYTDLHLDRVLIYVKQPAAPARSLKDMLNDLDALKSMPSEPEYPNAISLLRFDAKTQENIDAMIEKITSPSSISDEIKALIARRPDFFETGLKALHDSGEEDCPFCQQSIAHPPASTRIQLYIAYFADAEGKHRSALRTAWTEIKNQRDALHALLASLTRETAKFEALRKYVPSHRAVTLPNLSRSVDMFDSILGAYLSAIEAKGNAPGVSVARPSGDIQSALSILNQEIEAVGNHFAKLTAAVKASDAERRRVQREICSAFETEFVRSHWSDILHIHDLQRDIAAAKGELESLRKSQLSEPVKNRIASTFETLIKSFFDKKYTFDRDEFLLKRDNQKMARGASRTLSDGEKTAIAFCYFIACTHRKVKYTSDYAKIFFVFDDPITSLSYDFVFNIAQILRNMNIDLVGDISISPAGVEKNGRPDLLIFTHSSYFFNICLTNNVIKDPSAFFLYNANGEHRISNQSHYVAPFDLHLKEVFNVYARKKEPDHTTGNAVRCVIEAVGRFCHPDKCNPLTRFVTFLARDDGFVIKSVLINNMSHGTYYDEIPSPEDLREACNEAISIVEKYARGQIELVRALMA